jgi:hypothetical protein
MSEQRYQPKTPSPPGQNWLTVAVIFTVLALLLGGQRPRVNPGGPFISLVGDVLPMALAVAAIGYSLAAMRRGEIPVKVAALVIIVVAGIAIRNVLSSILAFWFRPTARGDLFGI